MEDSFYSDKRSFQPKGDKYIVFFLNDKSYGILSNKVAEIFQPLSITTLFNVPVWLLGIAGFRNEVISVIDLKKLWNKESSASSLKSKLIVLRSEESVTPIAFAVDKLSKIITLPDTDIKPFKEAVVPQIWGIASYESKTLHLLDAEKLLSSLAF
jgi:purine-binding chemotaxis protein CheW